ncbi:MAG: hypothetical protein K5905_08620 [Roseibium sp.]|uniref:hypothetical protein n=1 Tax=Roseibium sp. TaxID=1936156 RepID=UPI0026076439|nr:hypothetical protein [Roseibium sp.]MCV0425524.1 hypothetical protein [Roseibium sp.]
MFNAGRSNTEAAFANVFGVPEGPIGETVEVLPLAQDLPQMKPNCLSMALHQFLAPIAEPTPISIAVWPGAAPFEAVGIATRAAGKTSKIKRIGSSFALPAVDDDQQASQNTPNPEFAEGI